MDNKIAVKSIVSEAVKALRLALGDTQQQFAARLNLAISTVVRYELTRPPSGPTLAHFMQLADRNGRTDLASIFQEALSGELGYKVNRISPKREYRPEGLAEHDALESVLHLNGHDKERNQIRKILAPIIARNLQTETDIVATMGLTSQVSRMVLEGKETAEIVAAIPSANADLVRQMAAGLIEIRAKAGAK
jgi:transcriptional regulator with XRE-family HTH domain